MATHTELTYIPFQEGRYRFCLDRVVRDDEDGRIEYAFVWRGTAVSPDAFLARPAYFNWQLLGQLLRQALLQETLRPDELSQFLGALIGLEQA